MLFGVEQNAFVDEVSANLLSPPAVRLRIFMRHEIQRSAHNLGRSWLEEVFGIDVFSTVFEDYDMDLIYRVRKIIKPVLERDMNAVDSIMKRCTDEKHAFKLMCNQHPFAHLSQNQKDLLFIFETEIHQALKIKAETTRQSVSEVVNEVVRVALSEEQ